MIIEGTHTGPLDVNCWIVGCGETKECVVIDPGGDGSVILAKLKDLDLEPVYVINTHGHFDHIGGNAYLIRNTSARLMMHKADLQFLKEARAHALRWGMEFEDSPLPDRFLSDNEELALGNIALKILHTPGHSPGSISLLTEKHLFCGDLLFSSSIGRTDLPGGDFDQLISSVREKIFTLSSDTIVHPGHGPDTSVGTEKQTNPFFT